MRTPLLPLLLVGCGRYGQPEPDFADSLVQMGACGDAYFFARDPEGDTLLEATLPPVLEDFDGTEITYTYTLPVPGLEVAVSTGKGVANAACTDDVDGEVEVAHRWTAVEGELTLVVSPGEAEGGPPRGALELENVHLEGELQPLDIESFRFPAMPLGAFPG